MDEWNNGWTDGLTRTDVFINQSNSINRNNLDEKIDDKYISLFDENLYNIG